MGCLGGCLGRKDQFLLIYKIDCQLSKPDIAYRGRFELNVLLRRIKQFGQLFDGEPNIISFKSDIHTANAIVVLIDQEILTFDDFKVIVIGWLGFHSLGNICYSLSYIFNFPTISPSSK